MKDLPGRFQEMYRHMADKIWRDYNDGVRWAIETDSPLWRDVCVQDDNLFSMKNGKIEVKELQFRFELEKFKSLLDLVRQGYNKEALKCQKTEII